MPSAASRQHVRAVMITGDAEEVAQAVATDVGVDEVMAEMLPQDKVGRWTTEVVGQRQVVPVRPVLGGLPPAYARPRAPSRRST